MGGLSGVLPRWGKNMTSSYSHLLSKGGGGVHIIISIQMKLINLDAQRKELITRSRIMAQVKNNN